MSLLSINNLSVSFQTDRGIVQAVDQVSFDVDAGETLAIVGESGSGKSVTALSILQLLGDAGTISDGQIVFEGQNLLDLPEKDIRNIRGDRIAMIFPGTHVVAKPSADRSANKSLSLSGCTEKKHGMKHWIRQRNSLKKCLFPMQDKDSMLTLTSSLAA